MRITRTGVVATCVLAAALVAGGAGGAAAAQATVTLPDSVAAAVASSPVVGMVPTNQNLSVQLWLKGNDTGFLAEPPIEIFVMGANVWRSEREWQLHR